VFGSCHLFIVFLEKKSRNSQDIENRLMLKFILKIKSTYFFSDAEKFIEKYPSMDLEDTLKTALSKSMGEKETEGFNVYPVFRRGLKDCPYLRTSG